VEDLREDDASLKEASNVVYRQLSDGLSGWRRQSKIARPSGGEGWVTGLGITGISAATTAGETALMSGDVGVGLAAGVAGKIADSGLAHVKAVRSKIDN
jgi:hypothetical protein